MAVLLSGFLVPLAPGAASACSRETCPRDMLIPRSLPDTTVMVPANLPSLLWGITRSQRAPMAEDVRLTRVGVTSEVVPTTLSPLLGSSSLMLVRPTSPWVQGERYTLTTARLCTTFPGEAAPPTSTTFIVGPALPVPTTLGTLAVGPLSQRVMVVQPDSFNGTCGTDAEIASRDTTLTLTPEAAAWSELMLVQLLVDGAPRGLPRLGGGTIVPYWNHFDGPDQLPYVVCGAPSLATLYGLTPGTHRLQFRATIVGATETLLSNEVTAEFSCGPLRGDGGVANDSAVTDVPTTPSDVPAPPRDAAVIPGDAPASRDAVTSSDAAVVDVGSPPRMGTGGVCSVAHDTSRARGAGWALILAGMALVARRRAPSASAASGARRRPET